MPPKLAKHGSNAGYQREQKTGQICDRCRKAHRVYNKQYTKAGKAQGLHYGSFDVIDHLYSAGTARGAARQAQARAGTLPTGTAETGTHTPETEPEAGQSQAELGTGTGIGARLRDAVSALSVPQYVQDSGEIPEYLHTIDPDPEPADPDSAPVQDETFVITREGMVLIEENLGTYLSVIGMTLEMVDPYCGPILAENIENIVSRWSKVIARYPSAARIFMAKGGGTIMDWIGAIQATWPVLYAIYEHHLSRTVRTEKGRVMRVMNNGQASTVDPTMPPAQPDYAYTTH
jgi:hypothetical protein